MRRFFLFCALLCSLSLSAQDNVEIGAEPVTGMSVSDAVILGVVEGLTEYLPISSTGHLILTERALGIGSEEDNEAANAYAIFIQAGAILAILGMYWPYILSMLKGMFGKDPKGRRLLFMLLTAFMPAVIIGLTFEDFIKSVLFGMKPVVAAWIVGGIVILILEKTRFANRDEGIGIETMTYKHALIIGFLQCLAMWPGVSRSLSTILGGRFAGLKLSEAVTFSFLLGGMTLGASTCYEGLKYHEALLSSFGVGMLIIGLAAAFVSAIIAVKWMIGWLNKHGLEIFGYYRILLGLVVAGLMWYGLLPSY